MRTIVLGALVGALFAVGCGGSSGDTTTAAGGAGGQSTSSSQPSTGGAGQGGSPIGTGGVGDGGTLASSTRASSGAAGGGGDTTSSTGGAGTGGAAGAGGATASSAASTSASSTAASSTASSTAASSTAASSTASSTAASSVASSSSTGNPCTPPISGGTCDDFPQCGCQANENCDVLDSTGKTGCEPAGAVPAYSNCNALGQCGVGYQCVGSVCQPFCNSNPDCLGVGRECIQVDSADTGNPPIPADYVCTAGCDPINPSAICGTGTTCDFYDTTFTQCFGPVGFGVGANGCTQDNPLLCARGYICLSDNSCAKWCRVNSNDCGTGHTCLDLGDMLNGVEYGYCD